MRILFTVMLGLLGMASGESSQQMSSFKLGNHIQPPARLKHATDIDLEADPLPFEEIALTPFQARTVNPDETIHFCSAVCQPQYFVDKGLNMEVSFVNAQNPTWSPTGQRSDSVANMQVFVKGNYNNPNNTVNFKKVPNSPRMYRNRTIFAYDPSVYPSNLELCIAVHNPNAPGYFSFQFRWTSEPVSDDIWKVGSAGMPTLYGDAGEMRQFVQKALKPTPFQVSTWNHYRVRTPFCSASPTNSWTAILQVTATTPLSAFESFACVGTISGCGINYQDYWKGSDKSATAFNTVRVTKDGTSGLLSPDLVWAIYGIGAEVDSKNHFVYQITFLPFSS